ncbi:glycosyltransferase family 39 protein [bacterium]|nr:glycosyltransferase family 39 protein [bacterium]
MVLVPLICWFCFYNLGAESFKTTDETIHTRVTQEMLHSGNLLQPSFNHTPYHNKPPFKMWLSLIPMWLGHESKFSYRFIDAASGAGTFFAIYLIALRWFGSGLLGIFSVCALIGSRIFAFSHGYRVAVQDSIVVFFTTLAIYLGFSAIENLSTNQTRSKQFAAYSGILVGLSVLSKSAFGYYAWLVIALFVLAYGLSTKRYKEIFQLSLWAIIPSIVIPAIYLVPRLLFIPGVWETMVGQELTERFEEGYHNANDRYFYLRLIFVLREIVPPVLLGAGILFALSEVLIRKNYRWAAILIWAAFPIVFLSFLPSRLEHYIAPSFPALALLAGLTVNQAFNLLKQGITPWINGNPRGSFSAVICGTIILIYCGKLYSEHLPKSAARILNPRGPIALDSAMYDLHNFYKKQPSTAPGILIVDAPEFNRFESVYPGLVEKHFVLDPNRQKFEKLLSTPTAGDYPYFILTSQALTQSIIEKLPFTAYRAIPTFWDRDERIYAFAFVEPKKLPHWFARKHAIDIGSPQLETILGLSDPFPFGKLTVRWATGPQSQFLVDGDLLLRERPSVLSINLGLSPTKRTIRERKVRIGLNDTPLGEVSLKGSGLVTRSVNIPPQVWHFGPNVVTLSSELIGGEDIEVKERVLLLNWLAVEIK